MSQNATASLLPINGGKKLFIQVLQILRLNPLNVKKMLLATKYADDVSLLVNKELEKG
jgi:hypothetical protein